VKNVRYTLKTLQQIFTIRSCKYNLTSEVVQKKKVQLCLDYYIHKCKGPCQDLQSKEDYNKEIDRVHRFLKGKTDDLVKEIKNEMNVYSEQMEYEEAARFRDKLNALENYRNSQKVVYQDFTDRDILAVAKEDDDACAVLFKVRESKITGRIHYYMAQVEWKTVPEIIRTFIEQYYFKSDEIPQEIFIQEYIEDKNPIENWLSDRLSKKVNIIVPQQGEKKKLVELAQKNAKYLLDELKLQKLKSKDYVPHVVKALKRDLGLKVEPKHIECFDISNIQGTDPVASMVCFVDGKPKKSEYRRFKIQSKETPDDFAMMREVVKRRYSRLMKEKKKLPDLIVIDGGKGQLSSALGVLNELGIQNQQIIGLAKRLEEVFFPGINDAQMLPHTSSSLRLMQQVRDEAHRFAITFHRQRRKKRTITSELDKINGVGAQRRKQLLKTFGSIKKIKEVSEKELVEKGKIPKDIAQNIYKYFN
jgi:excinuclease ABC subunit C